MHVFLQKQYAESVLQNGIGEYQINNIHFYFFNVFKNVHKINEKGIQNMGKS